MKVQILGASGGIGAHARTTSIRVDDDILIDAGTGVGDLSLEDLRAIDHVFLTHSHLDHVAMLPFLLDTVGASRHKPVKVYAQEATLATLRNHLFSGGLWPDFSRIPSPEAPFLVFQTLVPGSEIMLDSRRVRSISVNHAVPAVGYLLNSHDGSLAFSGDTTVTDDFWRVLNATADLKYVVIETSFVDADEVLSRLSKHLCPSMLAGELKKLKSQAAVYVTHLTLVGAVSGAIPPVIGWVAASGPHNVRPGILMWELFVQPQALFLFTLLFLWQLPHFLSINWMYRAEYIRGGFVMWSNDDVSGRKTARLAIQWSLPLLALCFWPGLAGFASHWFIVPSLIATGLLLKLCFAFYRSGARPDARKLFFATLIYLPVMLIALLIAAR